MIGNLVYVENTGIYRKSYDKKHGSYRITEVFTNGSIQVQKGVINKQINIIWLVPHFDSAEPVPWRNQVEHIWGGNAVSKP